MCSESVYTLPIHVLLFDITSMFCNPKSISPNSKSHNRDIIFRLKLTNITPCRCTFHTFTQNFVKKQWERGVEKGAPSFMTLLGALVILFVSHLFVHCDTVNN